MINYKLIAENFKNLVGFRDSTDPTDVRLRSIVKKSDSNVFVNDCFDGIVNTKTMDSLLTFYDNEIPTYVAGIYPINSIVMDNGIYFKAKIETSEAPISNGIFWAESEVLAGTVLYFDSAIYDVLNTTSLSPIDSPSDYSLLASEWIPVQPVKDLSDELFELRSGAIKTILADIVNDKSVNRETKPFLDSFQLYSTVGHPTATVTKSGRRVGLQIELRNARALLFVLKKIMTQFNGVCSFPIQIHSANSLQPVATLTINHAKLSSFQVTEIENIFLGIDTESDGVAGANIFYISYLENDLPLEVNAISKELSFGIKNGCHSCNKDISGWARASPYFYVRSFVVESENLPTDNNELWDIENNVYTINSNFGLNFVSSVVCDETNVILENKDIFVSAIQYETAMQTMRKMSFSSRVSGLKDTSVSDLKNRISYIIQHENSIWLKEYNMVRQALRESLKNLEFPCFPAPRDNYITKSFV